MKKVNIILFIFLIIVVLSSTVYFSFFYGNDNIDYTLYKKVYNQLTTCENYTSSSDINITAKKVKITEDKYRINFRIDNAKFMMQDIDLLIIDDSKNSDYIYPSLGLLDDKHLDIIVDDNANENQKKGINLDYIAKHDVNKLFVYFAYSKNGERIENYFEVNVDVAS